MQQEVVLAMLAKEPSQGYQLRAGSTGPRPAGRGHERRRGLRHPRPAGEGGPGRSSSRRRARPPRAGPEGVRAHPGRPGAGRAWLAEVSWPKPDLAEFHLKLIAAAAAGLADPIGIVDAQRRELLRRLRDAHSLRWRSPMVPMRPCCSKESCSVSRRTCAGWRPASATWTIGGESDEATDTALRAPGCARSTAMARAGARRRRR